MQSSDEIRCDMVELHRNGEYERSVLIWYAAVAEVELHLVSYEPLPPGAQFIFRRLEGSSVERMVFESDSCELLTNHLWMVTARRIHELYRMPRALAA